MAEIFYTVSPELHRMARLEGGEVVELDFEIPEKPRSLLGAIFLGRVIEVQKPIQAAFVDIGEGKPGLLPFREGKLPSVKQGDSVLVQVSRTENPIEDKGVRLTRLITLALGPLLYTPFTPGLSLSKKLKHREAFKGLFSLRPEEGLVVRYWASAEDPLPESFLRLRSEWGAIHKQLSGKPPLCLQPAPDLLTRVLRGLNGSDRLVVDDHQIAAMTQGIAEFSREKVFDERCEDAWDSLLSPEISFPQGGSLYIEETRGLIVIDVNSQGALRHALPFNKGAIREALRQVRMRDLGGKIVVDLIAAPKALGSLLQGLDIPSNLEIWGVSPMGLLEMTRRRQRLSLPQRLKLNMN
ncbi:MAG TPA: ribonuclease E/G [Alphaproteobacteria bacterium]|nr:ribonuclease E/G [Alphaproteobacteria bacterium]